MVRSGGGLGAITEESLQFDPTTILLRDNTTQSTSSTTHIDKTTGVVTLSNLTAKSRLRFKVKGRQTVSALGNSFVQVLLKSGANTTTFSEIQVSQNNGIQSFTITGEVGPLNSATQTTVVLDAMSFGGVMGDNAAELLTHQNSQTLAGSTTWAQQTSLQFQMRNSNGAPTVLVIDDITVEKVTA